MNKKQWYVLSGASLLLGMLFMQMSLLWKSSCWLEEVNMMNIFSCVKGEILSAFVYIFFTFMIVFMILAWLEPKKK